MDPYANSANPAPRWLLKSSSPSNGYHSSSSGQSSSTNSPVITHNIPITMQEDNQNNNTNKDALGSSMREFKERMAELSQGRRGDPRFGRSVSTATGLRLQPPQNMMKRHDTSPAIVEMPTTGNSSPDSLEELPGPFPIVTSPVSDISELTSHLSDADERGSSLSRPSSKGLRSTSRLGLGPSSSVYHEERKTSSSSKTKIMSDNTSSEKTTATDSQMVKMQSGDISYQEKSAASASKARMQTADGTVAEHTSGIKHHSKKMTSGDLMHQESQLDSMSGRKVQGNNIDFHSLSQASSTASKTLSAGMLTESVSSKKMSVTRATSLLNTHQIKELMNMKLSVEELESGLNHFDDLECLTPTTNIKKVENALAKYCGIMSNSVEAMKRDDGKEEALTNWMIKLNDMMTKAWEVPAFGHEIGNTLCDIMRNNGGLDILIENCVSEHKPLQYNSAKLLQQCLVTENRGYVVEKGLDKVVAVAKKYTEDIRDVECSRVGTGILEHLFKHSETTCGDVIALGGLDTVVNECKSTDVETLRHCAGALANVAMYGGAENQESMIRCKVPAWLFPLAFHDDDTVKYYACLAIAALVANKEIEAAVQKSGALELIEPFVQTHTPRAFAQTSATHSHGQSPNWLKRLIPILMSHREEARNLAAFHFCMEAEIKKEQNKTELFTEIGAIESLKKVASSPNGIASKYAAQTLRLIGEEVPHKLSQQVPTWSVEDVKEWVKQIGFPQYSDSFAESRVDGDLLLQLSEEMLREDINMRNGILRRRFLRELANLKKMADYSCCDPTNLNEFLQSLGPEYSIYTYDLINAGIDRDTLLDIPDEQLLTECGITNKIHRLKIHQGVKVERGEFSIIDKNVDKSLDVFISYRRSNGSQLASLLKVHLEIRNFSVFLDVDRLEAGKFDNNLLQSIRSARNFVLVLTPGALDRCFGDEDQQDWIHKEIVCAMQSDCKIIPVFDNFVMPDPGQLPESMRAITGYNGVKWIHDYQEACVDKIDRFIRGDNSYMMDRFFNSQGSSGYSTTTSVRGNQSYQRMASNDNSTCSDEANQNSSSSAKDL